MILNNNFVNNNESIDNAVICRNISNLGKILSSVFLIIAFMVFGTTCFAEDFETNNIPKQTVDVTGVVAEAVSRTHDCNNYAIPCYTNMFHWKECAICSSVYDASGYPDTLSDDYANKDNLYVMYIMGTMRNHLIIKGSYGMHDLQGTWTDGTPNNCRPGNHYNQSCQSLGCKYYIPATDANDIANGKKVHNCPSTAYTYDFYLYSGYIRCTDCGEYNEGYHHHRVIVDGVEKDMNCTTWNLPCVVDGCGINRTVFYPKPYHSYRNSDINESYYNQTNGFKMNCIWGCGQTIGTVRVRDAQGTGGFYDYYTNENINGSTRAVYNMGLLVDLDASLSKAGAYVAVDTFSGQITELGPRNYSDNFNNLGYLDMNDRLYVTNQSGTTVPLNIGYKNEDANPAWEIIITRGLKYETTSPTVNYTLVPGPTVNGWTNSMIIQVAGTEISCTNVKVELVDKASGTSVVTNERVAVSDGSYTTEIIPHSYAITGNKTLFIKVTDTLGNSSVSNDFTISNIDMVVPTYINSSSIISNGSNLETANLSWTKSKVVSIDTYDRGVNIAETKIQNIANGLSNGMDFVDDYGYTTVVDSSSKTWKREYEFVGNTVVSTLNVYSKDALNNKTDRMLIVHKLDNTAPKITAASGGQNTITAKFSDNISGVNGYVIQTGDTSSTVPNVNSTTLWTPIDPSLTEQSVHTPNPETTSKVYTLNLAKENGTYTIWIKDQAGNTASSVVEVSPYPITNIPKKTIDVTDAVTETGTASHDCSAPENTIWQYSDPNVDTSKEFHWKTCRICYTNWVEQGKPNNFDVGTYLRFYSSPNINNGEKLLILTNPKIHEFQSVTWDLGTDTCRTDNTKRSYCSCGYAHVEKNVQAKTHAEMGGTIRYEGNYSAHVMVCSYCRCTTTNYEAHKDASGNLLGCKYNRAGTCATCGQTIPLYHDVPIARAIKGNIRNGKEAFLMDPSAVGKCVVCDKKVADLAYDNSHELISVVNNEISDYSRFTVNYMIKISGDVIDYTRSNPIIPNPNGVSSAVNNTETGSIVDFGYAVKDYSKRNSVTGGVGTITDKDKIWVSYTFNLNTDAKVHCTAYLSNFVVYLKNDPIPVAFTPWIQVFQDFNAPNIINTDTQNSEVVNGYTTSQKLIFTGTENYHNTVTYSIKKSGGTAVIASGTVAVTNKNFTIEYTPSNASSGTYILTLKDAYGNTREHPFELNDFDNKSPEFIASSNLTKNNTILTTATNWTKTKNATVSTQDEGVNIAETKLQNVTNGLGSGVQFEDSYGYTTKNESTTPTTWSREYEFVGNVREKTLRLNSKDSLNNETVSYLRICSLDNTAPKITDASGGENGITAKVSDNISGVNGYVIQTGNTTGTIPNINDSNLWTPIDPSLTEQSVHTPNPETTSKVYTLSESKEEGIYTIWIKDQAGNTASSVVEVSSYPITNIPKKTIDITESTYDVSNIPPHICTDENNLLTESDNNTHWQTCTICTTYYKMAGKPDGADGNNFSNQYLDYSTDASGDGILVIKGSRSSHTFGEATPTMPETLCQPNNVFVSTCSACGKVKKEPTTVAHTASTTDWAYNQLIHYRPCTVCGSNATPKEAHVSSTGEAITCKDEMQECAICHKIVGGAHEYSISYSGWIDKVADSSYTCYNGCDHRYGHSSSASYTVNGNNFTINIWYKFNQDITNGFTSNFSNPKFETGNNYAIIDRIEGPTLHVDNDTNDTRVVHLYVEGHLTGTKFETSIACHLGSISFNDNGKMVNTGWWVGIVPDKTAPAFTVSQEDKNSIRGWSTDRVITVSGTENYCGTVVVKMLDEEASGDKQVIFSKNVDVDSSKEFITSFVPEVESADPNKIYKIIVHDSLGNSASTEISLSKYDRKAPDIIANNTLSVSNDILVSDNKWSKTKDIYILARDKGIDIAETKIQNITNGLGNGVGFVDEYGYTTKDESTTPTSWTREYTFTGNINGGKRLRVDTKDILNNISYKAIEIYNLDNTAPKITEATGGFNTITAKFSDNISGVNGYIIQAGDTRSTKPDVTNARLWTEIDPEASEQAVHTLNPETTANVYEFYQGGISSGIYTIWIKDQAGNVASSEVVTVINPGDFETNYIPKQVIDITNATKDDTIISHNCSNYAVDQWDTVYHWKECSICSPLFKEASNQNDTVAWTINNSTVSTNGDGDKILIVKGSRKTHTYSRNSWSGTGKNDCRNSNHHYYYCDCGYSYYNDSGKKAHTSGGSKPDAPYNYIHVEKCTVCLQVIVSERCYKSKADKNKNLPIQCDNLGTCYICGQNYSQIWHQIQAYKDTKTIECMYCGKKVGDYNNSSITITDENARRKTIELKLKFLKNYNFDVTYVGYYESDNLNTVGQHIEFEITKDKDRVLEANGTYIYLKEEDLHLEQRKNASVYVHVNPYNGEYYQFWLKSSEWDQYLKRDTKKPVIKTATPIAVSTVNGWKTKIKMAISGTENYCKSVILSMVDNTTNKKILNNVKVPVKSEAWSYDFSPMILGEATGRNYTITVRDGLYNESSKTITLQNIDPIAPRIILPSSYPINWTKSKNMNLSARDEGVNIAELKIQNITNGLGNGRNFVDTYGYTTKNESTTPITWTRQYQFIGNVKGEKVLNVQSQDPLGNASNTYFSVYNLDNELPTINNSSIVINKSAKTLTVNLTDAFSGIKKFGFVQVADANTAFTTYPTANGTTNTTTAAEIGKWYQVSLIPANTANNTPESGRASVNVTLNIPETGYYYIVAEDYVGNRSYLGAENNTKPLLVELDSEPPTGSIRVIKYTKDNYTSLNDPETAIQGTYVGERTVGNRNVVLEITAADDLSGVDKIAIYNEDNAPTSESGIIWQDWATWSELTLISGEANGNATKQMNWQLSTGDGLKTIYLYIKDKGGNVTKIAS